MQHQYNNYHSKGKQKKKSVYSSITVALLWVTVKWIHVAGGLGRKALGKPHPGFEGSFKVYLVWSGILWLNFVHWCFAKQSDIHIWCFRFVWPCGIVFMSVFLSFPHFSVLVICQLTFHATLAWKRIDSRMQVHPVRIASVNCKAIWLSWFI